VCFASRRTEKKSKKDAPIVDNSSSNPIVPLTDEQQIDYMLSEVLGAWQIGDVEKMHQYYTDDVSVVKGSWEGPSIGWANYARLYKEQRDHMQQVRLDRMNTYIRVHGDTAWTNYQWEFSGVVDGELTAAHGQTTLVLIKVGNKWKIAHDHTSVVETRHGQPQGNTPPQAPAQPDKPSN
jgi:ketosteroid isomerase-like protein